MAIFLFDKSIACDRESANRLESMNAASEPLHESMLCNGTNLSLPRAQPKGAVNGAKSTRTLAPEEMLFEQLDLCRASLEGRSSAIFFGERHLAVLPELIGLDLPAAWQQPWERTPDSSSHRKSKERKQMNSIPEYVAFISNRESMYRFLGHLYKAEVDRALLDHMAGMRFPAECEDEELSPWPSKMVFGAQIARRCPKFEAKRTCPAHT